MKLYRLTVIGGYQGIDRGVWADKMQASSDTYKFFTEDGELVASYPVGRTVITNIETKEEYDSRKERDADYLKRLSK